MVSRLKTKWLLTEDPCIPDGAYELDLGEVHLYSFLREHGVRLWFIPAHLPLDRAQILISVEEEKSDGGYRMCRHPWVIMSEHAREQSLLRECATWYVLNWIDIVAFTDAPLF